MHAIQRVLADSGKLGAPSVGFDAVVATPSRLDDMLVRDFLELLPGE